jgi:hypothetical protein
LRIGEEFVEDYEYFSHNGDDGHLVGFAFIVPYRGIRPCGRAKLFGESG